MLLAAGIGLAVVVSGDARAVAATTLTVEPITWNVLGLDSNNVNVGPATYPVGARVCNIGSEEAAVTASFVWTTASPAMALEGPESIGVGLITAGACRDAYWNVNVTRADSSYGASRGYVIQVASTDGASASTPTPRELFVERLISQNRNSVNSITGPSAVTVGDEVTYVVDADTAPAGFEQLEAFLTFPTSMFQVLRVAVSYEKPVSATNDTMYADACGWDAVPTSPTYLSCVGPPRYDGGKVGGALVSTFTVRVVGAGTATLTSAIYDKSGSSFHYNTDYSVRPNLLIVTASAPAAPPTTAATTTTPAPTTTVPAASSSDDASNGEAPAAASAVTTTAVPSTSAGPDRRTVAATVATTGPADSGPLALVGLSLVSVGMLALGAANGTTRSPVPTSFERSLYELRRTLHDHDDAGPGAWLLMDALDRVGRELHNR